MNKKYKLKIPDMISKEDAVIAGQCKGVKECFEVKVAHQKPESYKIVQIRSMTCQVPSEWLEEIEDSPMSAEQAWENCGRKACYSNPVLFKDGFNSGEKNHAKRVQPVIDLAAELKVKIGEIANLKDKIFEGVYPVWSALDEALKQLEITNENN